MGTIGRAFILYLSSRSFEQGHQLGVAATGHRPVQTPRALLVVGGVGVGVLGVGVGGDGGDEAELTHEVAACSGDGDK